MKSKLLNRLVAKFKNLIKKMTSNESTGAERERDIVQDYKIAQENQQEELTLEEQRIACEQKEYENLKVIKAKIIEYQKDIEYMTDVDRLYEQNDIITRLKQRLDISKAQEKQILKELDYIFNELDAEDDTDDISIKNLTNIIAEKEAEIKKDIVVDKKQNRDRDSYER